MKMRLGLKTWVFAVMMVVFVSGIGVMAVGEGSLPTQHDVDGTAFMQYELNNYPAQLMFDKVNVRHMDMTQPGYIGFLFNNPIEINRYELTYWIPEECAERNATAWDVEIYTGDIADTDGITGDWSEPIQSISGYSQLATGIYNIDLPQSYTITGIRFNIKENQGFVGQYVMDDVYLYGATVETDLYIDFVDSVTKSEALTVSVDEIFTLDVNLYNATNIGAEDVLIDYDPAYFELVGMTEATGQDVWSITPSGISYDARYVSLSEGLASLVNSDATGETLYTIEFKALQEDLTGQKIDIIRTIVADPTDTAPSPNEWHIEVDNPENDYDEIIITIENVLTDVNNTQVCKRYKR